jgi:hypothetical protein
VANETGMARLQEWFGHASLTTTRLYDKHRSKPKRVPLLQGQTLEPLPERQLFSGAVSR